MTTALRRKTVSIDTKRLTLAPPQRAEFKAWRAARQASRAQLEPLEPTWSPQALSEQEWHMRLRLWKDGWQTRRAFVFLVHPRNRPAVLGGVSLTNVRPWPAQSADLGYWMSSENCGRGFMTEAVKGVCRWAFECADLKRVEAATVPENAASQRVLSKVGFKPEGRARAFLEIAGVRREHDLFGLLAEDMAPAAARS